MITRRAVLATPLSVLTPFNVPERSGNRRVTQDEFDYALDEHARWLDGKRFGRRANFSFCDLSGLDFGVNNPNQVVLRGADFTQANLSGIKGNDINFHHASFQYANLSRSCLKAPVFVGVNLSGADCSNVTWGWPASNSELCIGTVRPCERAVFMSATLSGVIFDHARVRGYFNDCSLAGASLELADLSQSELAGSESFNRFACAKLIRTKFRFATISSAMFNNAVIEAVDFLGSELHPRIAAHLAGRDVINLQA